MKKSELRDLINKAGIYPTDQQLLILKSALYPPDKALPFFNMWLEGFSDFNKPEVKSVSPGLPQVFDQIDLGSQRLLSLLYKNLKGYHTSYPILSKLTGYYKYIWFKNQLLKSRLDELDASLSMNNLSIVVIKGMVLIDQYYEDFGSRPTVDLDIAVQKKDLREILIVLDKLGWKSKYGDLDRIEKSYLHAHSFEKDGLELDLHTNFSLYALQEKTEAKMWEDARSRSENMKYLSPADELYCELLHGLQWNLIAPIRWIADSVKIIEKFSGDDWQKLSNLIQSEKYNEPLIMLRYLAKVNFATIPEHVLNIADINESNLLQNQYRYSLIPREENDMTMAQRVFYRILYTNNGNYIKSIRNWFAHYLYARNKKYVIQLVFELIKHRLKGS